MIMIFQNKIYLYFYNKKISKNKHINNNNNKYKIIIKYN